MNLQFVQRYYSYCQELRVDSLNAEDIKSPYFVLSPYCQEHDKWRIQKYLLTHNVKAMLLFSEKLAKE